MDGSIVTLIIIIMMTTYTIITIIIIIIISIIIIWILPARIRLFFFYGEGGVRTIIAKEKPLIKIRPIADQYDGPHLHMSIMKLAKRVGHVVSGQLTVKLRQRIRPMEAKEWSCVSIRN